MYVFALFLKTTLLGSTLCTRKCKSNDSTIAVRRRRLNGPILLRINSILLLYLLRARRTGLRSSLQVLTDELTLPFDSSPANALQQRPDRQENTQSLYHIQAVA